MAVVTLGLLLYVAFLIEGEKKSECIPVPSSSSLRKIIVSSVQEVPLFLF